MEPSWSACRFRRERSVASVVSRLWTVLVLSLIAFGAEPAGAQSTSQVDSTLAVPFSGVIKTDIENISIRGTLQIQAEATLTQTRIFAKAFTNISQITGVGLTTGQTFNAVAGLLKMCAIPIGSRSSIPVMLEIEPQFELVPSGRISASYARVREGSLQLVLQLTFRDDGTVTAANLQVDSGQMKWTPIGSR